MEVQPPFLSTVVYNLKPRDPADRRIFKNMAYCTQHYDVPSGIMGYGFKSAYHPPEAPISTWITMEDCAVFINSDALFVLYKPPESIKN